MFSYRIFREKKEVLVAVCDKEILGNEIDADKKVNVSEKFYGGEFCTEEELKKILSEATIINAIGNNVVNFLISEGIASSEGTIKVGGVLHAQIFTV